MDGSQAISGQVGAQASGTGSGKPGARGGWPWLKRIAGAAFLLAVLALLVSQARNIEWHKVAGALADYPVTAAWGAALLAVLSFALYSCFDLLGRRYTGHRLNTRAVMTTSFVSYVFNLNLGSLIGGIATRYRLYSRLGLETGVITRVVSMSMLTNWVGYLLLAGLLFSLRPPELPEGWKIDAGQLRFIGLGLLGLAMAYLAACVFRRTRHVQVRGHEIDLPSAPLAVLQLPLGAANWLVMSGILFILLQHRIAFPLVASVLLLAAVAGVVTHIPGNLGVLEAVFVALLSHKMPQHEVLAAIVAYRVVYYLVPLGIASVVYLLIEAHGKKLQLRRAAGTA
jgi:glycosyltransferase 2 family protein